MSEQLLLLLRFSLLGLVYLFLFRVVRAVWAELKPTQPAPMVPLADAPARSDRRRSHGRSGVPLSDPPTGTEPAIAGVPVPSPAPAPAPAAAPAAVGGTHLVVVSPADMAGTAHPLTSSECTVGRGGDCDVVVNDAYVSHRHALVRRVPDAWTIQDAGSTNGTWLNGERVTDARILHPGDHVAVGGVVMELR